MQKLTVGLIVRDVRGMTVGRTRILRSCCFEVQGERFHMNVPSAGIFNVDDSQVTLMCDRVECERYACPIHKVTLAASQPTYWSVPR